MSPTLLVGPNSTWTPAHKGFFLRNTPLSLSSCDSTSSSPTPSHLPLLSRLAPSLAAKRCDESPTVQPGRANEVTARPGGHGWQPVLLLPHHLQVRAPCPTSLACSSPPSRSAEISRRYVTVVWCESFRLISLQPVGKACANRARAHGCRIRADLARDQRFDLRSNPLSPLWFLMLVFCRC